MKDEYRVIIKSTNKFTVIKLLCGKLVYSITWIYRTENMFEQKVKQQIKEYKSLAYKYNTELKES